MLKGLRIPCEEKNILGEMRDNVLLMRTHQIKGTYLADGAIKGEDHI